MPFIKPVTFALLALGLAVPALAAEAPKDPPATLPLGPTRLSLTGELRFRFEERGDFDFDSRARGQQSFAFLRTRLGLLFAWKPISVFVEGVDSQEFVTEKAQRTQFNPIDLHQAWVEVRHPFDVPLSLKVGRQEMSLGSKLLVSSPAWLNNIRAFDLVRLSGDGKGWQADAFFGRVVVPDPDGFDTWRTGENFWGAYGTVHPLGWLSVDLYLLGLHDQPRADPLRPVKGEDGTLGSATRYTPGLRLWGSALGAQLGYEVEGVLQLGHRATDDVVAGAAHGALWWLFAVDTAPKVRVEANYASGDGDRTDGTSNTFLPLFGLVHDPYGLVDFIRWQNMVEAAETVSDMPHSTLELAAEYHAFWLADPHDAWVNAAGAVVRPGLAKGGSRFVGHEIDVRATFQPVPQAKLELGLARFQPGGFVSATGPDDPATWFYVHVAGSL